MRTAEKKSVTKKAEIKKTTIATITITAKFT